MIEETFASRFERRTAEAAESSGESTFTSVSPQTAGEVELLARIAARHSIPLKAVGAGTALYPGRAQRVLAVRFDAMREIRLPEPGEMWVEAEPGITWMDLEESLRARGMGPRVYPTSAPRSTVGGWLGENGVGVGSYEYGWLLENVISMDAVLAGGERHVIEGEGLRHFVGARGSTGFAVKARLATRPAAEDTPVGVIFASAEDLANAVLDLYRSGAPFWHLGFVNPVISRAAGFEGGHVLTGAYPAERSGGIEPALGKAVESRRGRALSGEEARRLWGRRFYPAHPSGLLPIPGRASIRGACLASALKELERKLRGRAIQGTVVRTGEVSLLAFDSGYLTFTQDLRLMRAATRTWMPERRKGRPTGPIDEL